MECSDSGLAQVLRCLEFGASVTSSSASTLLQKWHQSRRVFYHPSNGAFSMELILLLPIAAIEYSLIYMLGGGGIIGALVIFIIAKMLRR